MSGDDKIKRLLVDGEKAILSDSTRCYAGTYEFGGGRLVLTSKRLFLCGARSTFNRDHVIKKEFLLTDIANVQGDFGNSMLDVAGNSWLVVKPKVGEEWSFRFSAGASMRFWDFNTAKAMEKIKVSDWVNSIKLQLLKSEVGFRFCTTCGRKLSKSDFVFCPFCGNKLESHP